MNQLIEKTGNDLTVNPLDTEQELYIRRAIELLMHHSHSTAVLKGWWETERNFGEQVALQHSELSEVLEEWRKHGLHAPAFLYTDVAESTDPAEHQFLFKPGDKPEGIAAEYADILIRIFDTCERYQIPLAAALLAKMEYNLSRPYRHGGKHA